MVIINRKQAENMITNSDNIFGVQFLKKDKSIRKMKCRKRVNYTSKTGRKQVYKPANRGYITVFDMTKCEHRLVNINTLQYLNINKSKYKIHEHETNVI
jgi:hypothetical protein